jgi:hypothetical protein
MAWDSDPGEDAMLRPMSQRFTQKDRSGVFAILPMCTSEQIVSGHNFESTVLFWGNLLQTKCVCFPNVCVFLRWWRFGKRSDHKGGALTNGISAFLVGLRELSLFLVPSDAAMKSWLSTSVKRGPERVLSENSAKLVFLSETFGLQNCKE